MVWLKAVSNALRSCGAPSSFAARSYSMNAMVGDDGTASPGQANPEYVQFLNIASIPRPSDIFVFLDEHPDSINDGWFFNTPTTQKGISAKSVAQWKSLPGSYHDGAASFAFSDGHSEPHRWRRAATRVAPKAASLDSVEILAADVQDFIWVISTMSVEKKSDFYHN